MVDPSYDPDGVDPSDSESDRDATEDNVLAEHRIPLLDFEAQQALLHELIAQISHNPSDLSDVHGLTTPEHLFSPTPHVRADSLAVALGRQLARLRVHHTHTTPLMSETQSRITHWALMSQMLRAQSVMYQQHLLREPEQ